MHAKVAILDISFLHPPQIKILDLTKEEDEIHKVVFESKVGGINNNFDLENQDQECVPKAHRAIEIAQQEMFLLFPKKVLLPVMRMTLI
jgi:hypothetical protein